MCSQTLSRGLKSFPKYGPRGERDGERGEREERDGERGERGKRDGERGERERERETPTTYTTKCDGDGRLLPTRIRPLFKRKGRILRLFLQKFVTPAAVAG